MPERITVARATESPWDPNLRLAEIFKRRKPGIEIQREIVLDPEITLEKSVLLTVDPSRDQDAEDWNKVSKTQEFSILEAASAGNINFFQENSISSDQVILSSKCSWIFQIL